MQIRWQSWVAGSMQHQRRVLAALVLRLCGCGGIDAVELQVDDMAASRAALPEDEADDVMWPNDSPFLPQDCEDLATKVDSGVPTDCPRNKFVIGIAMGKGHNSDYNLPHTIRCCDMYSQRYGLIQKSEGDRTIRETLVDYDDMIYCSAGMTEYGMLAGQMMSGLTGGWGHSSNHNMPHQFTCLGLGFVSGWWVNVSPHVKHIYHQYSIRVNNRGALQNYLSELGIPTMLYYPVPLHLQKAYKFNYKEGDFPVSEMIAQEIISLPMHTELTDEQIDYICSHILELNK